MDLLFFSPWQYQVSALGYLFTSGGPPTWVDVVSGEYLLGNPMFTQVA